ncbi:MAG: hypothetical protein ACI38Y_06565 [Candidatus Methanomethylophilaceae archaeon]
MKTDVLLEPRSIKIILLIHGRGRISSGELMDIGSKYRLAHQRAMELESMGLLVSFPDDRLQSKVNWELTPKGGAVATLLQIVEDLGHGFLDHRSLFPEELMELVETGDIEGIRRLARSIEGGPGGMWKE